MNEPVICPACGATTPPGWLHECVKTTFDGFMDIRDHFAAAALSGLLARPNWDSWLELTPIAYQIADEMLAERSK